MQCSSFRMEMDLEQRPSLTDKILTATVVITALGNFIDMFDLLLFNMLRVPSLGDMGLKNAALTDAGLAIANCQWVGLLAGSYLWGVIGDRYGRKSSLLISILVYAVGSIASGCVHGLHGYMAARLVTGLGIAGELGSGLALISEGLTRERRGTGVAVFISIGFLGVVAAALTAQYLPWRFAYWLGGAAGLAVLLARTALPESAMFTAAAAAGGSRGGLAPILRRPAALRRYISGVFIIATSTFLPQIVWTLSPEIGRSEGLGDAVHANIVLAIGFGMGALVDVVVMTLSDRLRSRRRAGAWWLAGGIPAFLIYLFWPVHSVAGFYVVNAIAGLGMGGWALGCSWLAENFGTDIRATVTTTAPSLARALVIVMNLAYAQLKGFGALTACGVIGVAVFALAVAGWTQLPETFGRNLNFRERP